MISEGENVQRVLVADEDDEDFLIFSIAVNEMSYKVMLSRVTSGEALMKALEENLPDVLFLDMLIPYSVGKQCLKDIRTNRKYDALPVIMYTSMDDLTNIEFCYREGANLYAIKPHSLEELKDILMRILTVNWKKTFYFPPRDEFVIR